MDDPNYSAANWPNSGENCGTVTVFAETDGNGGTHSTPGHFFVDLEEIFEIIMKRITVTHERLPLLDTKSKYLRN